MTANEATGDFRAPTFTIWDRLGKARVSAGLTQDELGALLGYSRRTIARYEAEGTHLPRSILLAWHVATHTDLTWLETGIASWEPPPPDIDLDPESPKNQRLLDATIIDDTLRLH